MLKCARDGAVKGNAVRRGVFKFGAVGAVAAGVGLGASVAPARADRAADIIAGWPATSQKVARTVMAKYGRPNEVTASMLVWNGNGTWKRTVVYRTPVPHHFPVPHPDLLEQFIDYRVPPSKFDDLALFDGSLIVERTKGVMSARCDKEPMNLLALNLAHDIVIGRRSVAEARAFYGRAALMFMNGMMHPYTMRLQFRPRTYTNQPDKPLMTPAQMRMMKRKMMKRKMM